MKPGDPDGISGWDALLLAVFFLVLIFTIVPKEMWG